MADQVIPNGTYTIMGPGGMITSQSKDAPLVMLRPEGDESQQWKVTSDSGTYTLRSVASGRYLGDREVPSMMIKGTEQPFAWNLSTGDDDREETYVLTPASNDSLVLTMSLLRIFPPPLAILDAGGFSTFEWEIRPV